MAISLENIQFNHVSDIESIRKLYEALKGDRIVLTLKEFSKAVGYHGGYLAKVLNGHDELNQDILDRINRTNFNAIKNVLQKSIKKKSGEPDSGASVQDVDAFIVSTQIRQEALLQTMLGFMAEIGAPQLKMPVTKVLSDLQKAVSSKEEELRAAVKKSVS